jgi:hypothetical protein
MVTCCSHWPVNNEASKYTQSAEDAPGHHQADNDDNDTTADNNAVHRGYNHDRKVQW